MKLGRRCRCGRGRCWGAEARTIRSNCAASPSEDARTQTWNTARGSNESALNVRETQSLNCRSDVLVSHLRFMHILECFDPQEAQLMRRALADVATDHLLTEREDARLFGVSPSTVARMSEREVSCDASK